MTQARQLLRYVSSSAADRRARLSPTTSSALPALSAAGSLSSPLPASNNNAYRCRNRYYQSQGRANAFRAQDLFTVASAVAATGGALLGGSSLLCDCEASSNASSNSGLVGASPIENEEDKDDLPTYIMAEVSKNNGKGTDKVWMTYGGCVYDATDFIVNHPGGSEKILLAAGGPIEPHWHLYRQHFASQMPLQLMESMLIGYLHEDDQAKVDEFMDKIAEMGDSGDPYINEPVRSSILKVHSEQSMNAEVPRDILRREYITPVEFFYIRHHHPVPVLSKKEVEDFRLDVDLSLLSKVNGNGDKKKSHTAKLSLAQIKSLPKVEVITTLQCSGNRRSGFNNFRMTSGTPWDQGAISTAKWGGARLVDVLILASEQLADDDGDDGSSSLQQPPDDTGTNILRTLQNLHKLLDQYPNLKHLRFESLDGVRASIDILKALSPFGDVLIVYEMNGRTLPRDHGYPLRVIVPGYAAVRNVKWLSKLELAEEQAEGPWQRGLNYKVLPPSVIDAKEVDLDKMPGLGEVSVFSGITNVSMVDEEASEQKQKLVPGETVLVKASGWAWAGGGRNVVRVDVTGDNGKSWVDAKITQGSDQLFGRAWAWVFWECPAVPATIADDGVSIELSSKGVDTAFNTQPESSDGLWNVRGLANNSWYRLRHKVIFKEL